MPGDINNLLAVNVGSSSVRLSLFCAGGDKLEPLARVRHDLEDDQDQRLLAAYLDENFTHPDLVVHRVVHGGSRFEQACFIDAKTEAQIEELEPIAPLHNPQALRWIRACRDLLGPGMPQVAVFDTSFFTDLPGEARIYALPGGLCREFGLRRYGFHGIAHGAMLRSWQEQRPDLTAGGRVITVQLGSGCSMTAVGNGKVRDTSMGFSPLEGLVMATRPGDVDPGVIVFLQRQAGMSPSELEQLLYRESGLKGISEISGDMRVLLNSSEPAARLAIDIYCQRVCKYVGAYTAVLGGVDGIVFGGGVGENSPPVRERILNRLAWQGVSLDAESNERAVGIDAVISDTGSRVEVRVVKVAEGAEMARQALALVNSEAGGEGG